MPLSVSFTETGRADRSASAAAVAAAATSFLDVVVVISLAGNCPLASFSPGAGCFRIDCTSTRIIGNDAAMMVTAGSAVLHSVSKL
ncbi:hypothetical protein SCUCBS95973_007797 [Sporothrix curviconia]|uniref:Secreted protein n=1 Tax=Sporothrix curviconia TaxID=1260050 RepID=A0ABP0CJ19_9PEZI